MDNKTIIAVVLSVIVIIGSMLVQQVLFPPPDVEYENITTAQDPVPGRPPGESVAGDGAPSGTGTPSGDSSRRPPIEGHPVAVESDTTDLLLERTISKETALFRIVFNTRGGTISSLTLKEHVSSNGEPVEMIYSPDMGGEFFTVAFGDYDISPIDDLFLFREIEEYTWEFSRDFQVPGREPFSLRKTFRFHPNAYIFEVSITIVNSVNEFPDLNFGSNGRIAYTFGIGPQIGPPYENLDGRNEFRRFLNYDGDKRKVQKIPREGVAREQPRLNWTAIDGKYFTVIAVPDTTEYLITYDERKDPVLNKRSALYFGRPPIESSRSTDSFKFYIGPKKREVLASYNDTASDPLGRGEYHFEQTVDTPILIGWLASLLRLFLNLFYRLVPNYGIAIILLTIFIKAVFFPLTHKSYESTSKMQALSPKVEELKKRFKGKPEIMNRELAALYKREGAKPLGGCLPLLLQMPIFFALYNVLNNHFDLRGAGFISPWISDLSSPERVLDLPFVVPFVGWDELRILPFIMLATTFLQSMVTQTGSTTQSQMKIMMYAMPIFFFFILYDMPSGLVLYWTMQNILSIFQQLYINYRRQSKQQGNNEVRT